MNPAAAYGVAAAISTIFLPDFFTMNFLPGPVFHIIGGILIGFGLAFLLIYWPDVKKAVLAGKLKTSGPFSIVRNPLYFAWVVCVYWKCSCFTSVGALWNSQR